MSKETDIVVVGGGISGLTCAWRLRELGREVLVLEKDEEAGGNVRTVEESGYRLEWGPHSFLGSSEAILELTNDVGMSDDLAPTRPAAKARFIVRGGRLHPAPLGPWSFLTTSLLSCRGKLALATEPWRIERGDPDDTAARFFDRRFGPEAARVIAGAFVSGVYAGDPKLLSAAAAFPLFWRFEQETGSMIRGALRYRKEQKARRQELGIEVRSGLLSFEGGLGKLTGKIAEDLGERCRTSTKVTSIAEESKGFTVVTDQGDLRCQQVVVAAPPHNASRMLEALDQELAELLLEVPMAPVAVLYLGYEERCQEIPDGFGFLVPRGEDIRTLGVLFPSRLFSDRAPEGGDLLTAFVGGMTDGEALELDDEELRALVTTELETLTGLEKRPEFVRIRRHSAAIPQLVTGHLDRMSQARERLALHPGLQLAGNYLTGVGMKDAVASGFDAAALCTGDSPT